MGSDMSKCSLHGKECPVPSVDCLLIGTSCKDLSRANSSVDKSKLVLAQESSRGASAQTFRGMLSYCEGHRPTLILFENVDAIDDKVSSTTETNLSLLMGAMKDLGYEGQKIMTDGQGIWASMPTSKALCDVHRQTKQQGRHTDQTLERDLFYSADFDDFLHAVTAVFQGVLAEPIRPRAFGTLGESFGGPPAKRAKGCREESCSTNMDGQTHGLCR